MRSSASDGPSRACPRHRLELVERDDGRGLRCPAGHTVEAWVVIVDGQVVGAGRLQTSGPRARRNRPGGAWLAPEALAYVRYEARTCSGPIGLEVREGRPARAQSPLRGAA
jgi:hypothetical protein